MSHSVRRKSAIRSIPAIRAACAAAGIGEECITVNGQEVTVASKVFTGAYSWERPVPVVFNLATGEVSYDADFTAQISAFVAGIVAQQIKLKARTEGHSSTTKKLKVNGKNIIRVTVEA
jgi:hypothetical protein